MVINARGERVHVWQGMWGSCVCVHIAKRVLFSVYAGIDMCFGREKSEYVSADGKVHGKAMGSFRDDVLLLRREAFSAVVPLSRA